MLWRKTSTANKTCPVCRVKSSFVVKTSVYPYNPGNNTHVTSDITNSPGNAAALKESGHQIGQPDPEFQSRDNLCSPEGKLATSMKEGVNGTTALVIGSVPPGHTKRNYFADKGIHIQDAVNSSKVVDTHNQITCERFTNSSPPVATASGINFPHGAPVKRKRTRRKPVEPLVDSNPAKTLLVSNYLQRTKTIPCKYFCNPNTAKAVTLDGDCDDSQSICWGYASTNERKIPFCKYGNACHYSHPHPDKIDDEYEYDEWERRTLGISRRRKRKDKQDVSRASQRRQAFFVMAFLASAESPSIYPYPFWFFARNHINLRCSPLLFQFIYQFSLFSPSLPPPLSTLSIFFPFCLLLF